VKEEKITCREEGGCKEIRRKILKPSGNFT
jgi:hypothetical protein